MFWRFDTYGGDECEMVPCQIGSIRPRRQARGRRSLQPSKTKVPSGKQWFLVHQIQFEWREQIQSFGDQIAMEGTDATGTLPKRQHSSATPSPRATYTPSFQTNGPLWKTMLSILYIHNSQILENNSQSCNLEQCFGDLIAMEGTNANGAMPNRQHTSATPSPRATYTPTFQNKGQI